MDNSFKIDKANLSTLEEEVLTRLESLEPLRPTVDGIDPRTTVVATMGDWFSRPGGGGIGAAEYYASVSPALERMPDFVLLDWERGKPRPAWKETAAKYHVNIIHVTNIDSINHKNIILFVPEADKWLVVKQNYRRVRSILERFNIHKYCIEGAFVKKTLPGEFHRIPGFVAARFSKICTVYDALADDESKDTFLRVLKAHETGEPGYRPIARYRTYAHPLVDAYPGDTVIDGGLCDEGQILTFLRKIGKGGRAVGFEPVHELAEDIKAKLKTIPNVQILECGLWSENTTSHISVRPNGGSHIVNRQEKNVETCRLTSIDNYVKETDGGFHRGLIKLDVEGAEIECLKGAAETLRRCIPKLQICLYHHPNHYVDIPLMLLRMNLGYKLYMGHHGLWKHDTCLYALPPGQEPPRYRLSKSQKLVFRLITPVVKKLADVLDFQSFKRNPAVFFNSLASRKYRIFGKIFFPLP
jgi:FkbM family methyltransferase